MGYRNWCYSNRGDEKRTTMTRAETEAAAWRIWYRMKERGKVNEVDLRANCGVGGETFNDAISALISMGQITETWPDNDKRQFELRDEEPRMMQVFPTYND